MARIRTIKPDFFRHRKLYLAEREAGLPLRVAFSGLWTVADREGRFRWEPEELKLDCLPYDDVDFSAVMDSLERGGFVVRYEIAGKVYGYIPSWSQHQVINQREAKSNIPAPPSTTNVDDAQTRTCTHVHAHGEGKGKEEEGKGREDAPPPDPTLDVIQAFDDARAAVFGDNQRRMWPHNTDRIEAQSLLDAGATLETCRAIFRGVFERQKAQGKQPASSIRYMRDAVLDAIPKQPPPQKPPDPVDLALAEAWKVYGALPPHERAKVPKPTREDVAKKLERAA